jgi:hypothetical protein
MRAVIRNFFSPMWAPRGIVRVVGIVLCLTAMETAVRVQVAGPLPGWFDADIGPVGKLGYSAQGDDTFRVSGAGANIWGTSDSFHFTYTALDGDGDIYAFVRSQTAAAAFAKAGLMIRKSVDPSSPHMVFDIKPDGATEFMGRFSQGGNTLFLKSTSQAYPVYLRLTRRGSSVAAFVADASVCSSMGCNSWTNVTGWRPTGVYGPALMGFAVTSQDPSTINTAVFDFWAVKQLAAPWQQTDLYSEVQPDSAFTLPGPSTRGPTFIVPGAGTDIWGIADSFKYVWQQTSANDTTIIARASTGPYTHPLAKAGVMLRTNPGHPRVTEVMLDVNPNGNLEFLSRPKYGAETVFITGSKQSLPAWLRLTRSGNDVTAFTSADGLHWTALATTTADFSDILVFAGLAATSHGEPISPDAGPIFDSVALSAVTADNLLYDAGFEVDTPPTLARPGWTSDRNVAAATETREPHTGRENAACRSTIPRDCGMYQDIVAPTSATYVLTLYANADRPGVLVGANVNGSTVVWSNVEVRGAGNYGPQYRLTFNASLHDRIRVWLYSPATPGSAVIDDIALAPSFD